MLITEVNFHFDTRNTRKPITFEQYAELIRRVDQAVEGFGICDVEIKCMVPDDYEYPEPAPRLVDSSRVRFVPFDSIFSEGR